MARSRAATPDLFESRGWLSLEDWWAKAPFQKLSASQQPSSNSAEYSNSSAASISGGSNSGSFNFDVSGDTFDGPTYNFNQNYQNHQNHQNHQMQQPDQNQNYQNQNYQNRQYQNQPSPTHHQNYGHRPPLPPPAPPGPGSSCSSTSNPHGGPELRFLDLQNSSMSSSMASSLEDMSSPGDKGQFGQYQMQGFDVERERGRPREVRNLDGTHQLFRDPRFENPANGYPAQARLPIPEQAEQAELHQIGQCSPCHFETSGRVCRKGEACIFCHAPHERQAKPRPRKSKRVYLRKVAEELDLKAESSTPKAFAEYTRALVKKIGGRYMKMLVRSKLRKMLQVENADPEMVETVTELLESAALMEEAGDADSDIDDEELKLELNAAEASKSNVNAELRSVAQGTSQVQAAGRLYKKVTL